MCLILISWRTHPQYSCVIAANRDEFHARATLPAHWWTDRPQVFAGRDLAAGGTWLGITRTGRFAALTNFRRPADPRADAPSRGALVTSMLESDESTHAALARLRREASAYNGFNLLFSDGERLLVFESVLNDGRELGPGVYGLSNHLLDTPWHKLQRAKSAFQRALAAGAGADTVLEVLRDDARTPDDELPDTGVGLEWERLLSSPFIRAANYGTRSSTLLRIDQGRRVAFDEWSWNSQGDATGRVSAEFELA